MADVTPSDDTPSDQLGPLALAEQFGAMGARLAGSTDTSAALQALAALTAEVVPGARWVSVTRGLGGRFTTIASTDPVAGEADAVQYRRGTGPCIDAVVDEAVFTSSDLARDERWDHFGPEVARDLGIHSVLSVRLTMEEDEDLNAGLNIYGDHVDAFDETSHLVATLLATHAAVAVAAVVSREQSRNLRQALQSNREIGVAMGVVMNQYRMSREQAFDLLRIASQNSNRKLRDLATEVADTGVVPLPAPRPTWRGRPTPGA